MNILIISGGQWNKAFAKKYLEDNPRKFDRIIVADKGLGYCHGLGLMPTDILGDFDSLEDAALLAFYEKKGVPVHRYPPQKDDSDTELAVRLAISLAKQDVGQENRTVGMKVDQKDTVTMLACTGTRYDHSLANVGLLELFCQASMDAVMVDEHNEIRMAVAKQNETDGGKTEIILLGQQTEKKCYYSLIPWSGEVTGVTLKGFAYPLTDHTLKSSESLAISNELVEERGVITFLHGKLLVIRAED